MNRLALSASSWTSSKDGIRASHSSSVAVLPVRADGVLVKLPDRIDHRMVVRVENVFLIFGMAGDVKLGHALRRNGVQIIERIETVVARGDIDIIDIQQDAAIGPLHHFGQKFPLGHFRNMKLRVAADVFHRDGHFQKIARLADFARP